MYLPYNNLVMYLPYNNLLYYARTGRNKNTFGLISIKFDRFLLSVNR